MKFKQKKKKEWKKTAKIWTILQPPYKPGSERIKLYKKFFQKYSPGKKVLLLGATPELRDMLAKDNCDVTLVDQSSAMLKAMTSLRRTKSKEKIVIKNWLEYHPKEKYDAIFGDTILNNLHSRTWLKFEHLVRSWLSDNGVFITEITSFFKTNFPKYDYIDLIKTYRKNPDYFKDFRNKTLLHFFLWWKHKTPSGWVPIYKIDNNFKKLYQQGKITKKEFYNTRIALNWRGTVLSGRETRNKLTKVFKIVEESIEEKHPVYKNFYRLFVLKAK